MHVGMYVSDSRMDTHMDAQEVECLHISLFTYTCIYTHLCVHTRFLLENERYTCVLVRSHLRQYVSEFPSTERVFLCRRSAVTADQPPLFFSLFSCSTPLPSFFSFSLAVPSVTRRKRFLAYVLLSLPLSVFLSLFRNLSLDLLSTSGALLKACPVSRSSLCLSLLVQPRDSSTSCLGGGGAERRGSRL